MKLGQAPAATILRQQDGFSIRAALPEEEIDTFYGWDKRLLLAGNRLSCYDLGGGNLRKQLALASQHLASQEWANVQLNALMASC
jgi:hypothetical protein